MGGFALGRMLQGGVEALDKTEARRDRETSRERTDTAWDQGQEERDYTLKRRGITDSRTDEQYQIAKDKQTRFKEGSDALRTWSMSGEIDGINSFANKYSPEGLEHLLEKKEDGTYSATTSFGDKSETKTVSEDEIGTYMQVLMTQDPYASLTEKLNAEKALKEKGADRDHDLSLIRAKGAESRKTERVKAEYKDGKSGAAKAKSRAAISKEHNDIAVQDYGTLFGDQWGFNKTQDKTMRAAQANLADAYYFASDDPNITTNSSGYSAFKDMQEFLKLAEDQANKDIENGEIDKKEKEAKVVEYIDDQVSQAIKAMAPKPGESLQRGGEQQPVPASETGTDIPLDDIQLLKKSPTDENKKYFDETYGDGAADKILTGEEITGKSTTSTDVSREGKDSGVSLVREASASEAQSSEKKDNKKPKLTRQQHRREGKKSQKEHSKIAVSEYKNEWVNMDDSEKIEWWTDNAQALKAASPRSHKKANKEIIEIRNKSKIGRPSRAAR